MEMTTTFKRRLTLGAVAVASLAAGMVLASRLNLAAPARAAAEREDPAPAAGSVRRRSSCPASIS